MNAAYQISRQRVFTHIFRARIGLHIQTIVRSKTAYDGVEITPFEFVGCCESLGGCKFGHSLCALRDGVLRQLSRKDEPDSGLDLARSHSGLLVVAGQLSSLCGNLLENVGDEGVQKGDSTRRDSSVRVHLQHCNWRLEGLLNVTCVRY